MTELQVLSFAQRGIIDRIKKLMDRMPDVAISDSKEVAEELLTLHSYRMRSRRGFGLKKTGSNPKKILDTLRHKW